MTIITLISFFLALFSIILSVFFYKRSGNGSKVFIYCIKKSKIEDETFFILYNKSKYFITKDNIYKDVYITCESELELESESDFDFEVLLDFKGSKVIFSKEHNQLNLDIDYIGPRSYALIGINKKPINLTINGIIKDYIVRKRTYEMSRKKRIGYLFILDIFLTSIFMITMYSMFFDNYDSYQVLNILSILLFPITAIFIIPYAMIRKRAIHIDAYNKINQIIKEREKRFKNKKSQINEQNSSKNESNE